jgi:hypothetical protein
MTPRAPIVRAAAVLSSLTLLAAYVWHSQVTPNTPPPDPLGLSTIELKLEPETVEFDGFVDYGEPVSAGNPKRNDLRIVSSKVINQPIFSVRQVISKTGLHPGSEMPYFRIDSGLPSFNLFDRSNPPAPPP